MKSVIKIVSLLLGIGFVSLAVSCREKNVPTIEPQSSQSLQRQGKLLILTAHKFGKPLTGTWCDDLKATDTDWPNVETNTVFVLNIDMLGKKLTDVPASTVVFFSSDKSGWNQVGKKPENVSVIALADGRALKN